MTNELFPKCDADIFCLNEVSESLYRRMQRSPYFKDYYFTPHRETVIVSRIPSENVYQSPRVSVHLFTLRTPEGPRAFVVVAAHLLA